MTYPPQQPGYGQPGYGQQPPIGHTDPYQQPQAAQGQPAYPPQGYTDPYQQQGYQQQPPPAQAGGGSQGWINLDAKFFPLAWILYFFKPKVFINGQQYQAQWNQNQFPVPPGNHHVHVEVPYFLPPKLGPADIQVPVAPGQQVSIEYRAPVWQFSPGALGPAPQPWNGTPILIAIYAVLAVLIICSCALPFIG
ncbi:hypothetical protein Afil01_55790 [Actinorhabdospora filicis]|uniref:Uncharacterized protein n=1 Tax=Actinorhabdospora filicis TaxID=1785913 RepID=A0A9W6SRA6_9ACTN|nr:hypothetical protein [Actinorhabdospora filicis]GLZ80772.1 hypothetical protein Afil01_55790 [Actinorhabdospora filicis]